MNLNSNLILLIDYFIIFIIKMQEYENMELNRVNFFNNLEFFSVFWAFEAQFKFKSISFAKIASLLY